MRTLFISEQRAINNVFPGPSPSGGDYVIDEWLLQSSANEKSFNGDFVLRCQPELPARFKSIAKPILPNTVGAELFITRDVESNCLYQAELMGGPAFPYRYYAPFVKLMERRVLCGKERLARHIHADASQAEHLLSKLSRVRGSLFARIMLVGDDLTFLLFATNPRPLPGCSSIQIAESLEGETNVLKQGAAFVGLDGWMKCPVAPSEWQLVAE